MSKKIVLGKGLDALLDPQEIEQERNISSSVKELPLDRIVPNPYQPRTDFDTDALQELALSIKSIGLVQPITVRLKMDGMYEIIAGERRYRAAKIAGLDAIPAYIRETDNDEILALALIENIQREDLNAMEVAFSYRRLMDECKLTQESLSDLVGKKRATIANYVRLLNLPAEIQLAVREKRLSMGHARALLSLEDTDSQLAIYEQIQSYDLSVRKVEELIKHLQEGGEASDILDEVKEEEKEKTGKKSRKKADLGAYSVLQDRLRNYFNKDVQLLRNSRGKGKIVLPFNSDEELEHLMSLLDKTEN